MKKIGIEHSLLEIPTYPWSGEDKEAPFIRELTPRGQPIYPYKPLEHLFDKSELRTSA